MNRKTTAGIFLLLLLLVTYTTRAQVFTDPEKAFTTAAAAGKPVLLVFQGSDWCIPCIQLEKKVLSTESFLRFTEDSLVVLKADFPQRKKIDPAYIRQYEKLAETFNPEGAFPKVLLLDAQQKNIATVPVHDPEAVTFIAAVKELIRAYAAKI